MAIGVMQNDSFQRCGIASKLIKLDQIGSDQRGQTRGPRNVLSLVDPKQWRIVRVTPLEWLPLLSQYVSCIEKEPELGTNVGFVLFPGKSVSLTSVYLFRPFHITKTLSKRLRSPPNCCYYRLVRFWLAIRCISMIFGSECILLLLERFTIDALDKCADHRQIQNLQRNAFNRLPPVCPFLRRLRLKCIQCRARCWPWEEIKFLGRHRGSIKPVKYIVLNAHHLRNIIKNSFTNGRRERNKFIGGIVEYLLGKYWWVTINTIIGEWKSSI